MPYPSVPDLPEKIKSLPFHAREIYRKTFNNAWREYANPSKRRGGITREVTAHRVAWNAVKRVYVKTGDRWIKK